MNIIEVSTDTFTCSFGTDGIADEVEEVVESNPETWYFNETVDVSTDLSIYIDWFSIYISDSDITNYSGLLLISDNQMKYYRGNTSMTPSYNVIAYKNSSGWNTNVTQEDYLRTVTFSSSATGDLLTFLQANATKIS